MSSSADSNSIASEKERGFSTYFQGANKDISQAGRAQSQRGERKGWGDRAVTILGRKLQPSLPQVKSDSDKLLCVDEVAFDEFSKQESAPSQMPPVSSRVYLGCDFDFTVAG
jgi:hypothetical protein